MKKASELYKSLTELGALPSDEITNIVAGAIDRGEVTDDLDIGGLDPGLVKSLVAEMRDSLKDIGGESFAKSEFQTATLDQDGDFIDVATTLDSVVKASNSQGQMLHALVSTAQAGDTDLAKGVLALGQLTELALGETADLAKSMAEIQKSQALIMERLRIPVAPRAVRGDHVAVPHPSETTMKSDGSGVSPVKDIPTAHTLLAKARAEQEEMSKSDDPQAAHRMHELAAAVSRLEAGVSPETIMAEYKIGVA